MKRKAITKTMTILLALAFTLVSVSGVSAQPNKPLRCEMSLEFDWVEYKWFGTVTGDISGDIIVTPGAAWFLGATEHFFETWNITDGNGEWIAGFDEGVWGFKNLKVRTNGRITAASEDYAYLIGCKVHMNGTTSALTADPLTATCTMRIH